MVRPFFIGVTIAQTIRRWGSWCWWSDGGEPLLQFSWPVHSSMAMFKNEFTLALPKINHISTNLASDFQTPGAWPSTTTAKARKATKKRALMMWVSEMRNLFMILTKMSWWYSTDTQVPWWPRPSVSLHKLRAVFIWTLSYLECNFQSYDYRMLTTILLGAGTPSLEVGVQCSCRFTAVVYWC